MIFVENVYAEFTTVARFLSQQFAALLGAVIRCGLAIPACVAGLT
jgi:hypothetical protein